MQVAEQVNEAARMTHIGRWMQGLLMTPLCCWLGGISCSETDRQDGQGSGGVLIEDSDCLVGGTRIATPDGPRLVEKLQPGDLVISYDGQGGTLRSNRVIGNRVARRQIGMVSLPGGGQLRGTAEHPVYDNRSGSYVQLAKLSDHAALIQLGSAWEAPALHHEGITWAERELDATFALTEEFTSVYNLSVARDHNYFAEGVLVHNKSLPCDDGWSSDCHTDRCAAADAAPPVVCAGQVAVVSDERAAQVVVPESELADATSRGLRVLSFPPPNQGGGGAGGEAADKDIIVAFSLQPDSNLYCYQEPGPFLTVSPGRQVEIAVSDAPCAAELVFEDAHVGPSGYLTLSQGLYTHVRIPTAELDCLKLGEPACKDITGR